VTRVDAAPILSLDEAVEQCRSWHDHGLRIVLTNGAFDLLHVGHLRYLADAASHADRLVVALNTDHSVQLSKGPDRPIVPQAERAEMIATVRCVDLVVPFDDRTVGPVLETLQPDVHAKGTDYTVASVPERAVVEAYGGRTVICGDAKDHATTDVIATILDRFGGS
jgi:rfaE bifunctional protein nucleotidyltransferase chain/domain